MTSAPTVDNVKAYSWVEFAFQPRARIVSGDRDIFEMPGRKAK